MSAPKLSSTTSVWIKSPKPNRKAKLRLFCFPYAGGGALTFRTWPASLPPDIEVCSIHLPGHESRLREPAFDRLAPLVDALMPELVPFMDRPFAFFGHSMGALIGFEVASRLRSSNAPPPEQMFVSGRRAPQLPTSERRTFELPEPEFIEELRRLNGTPHEVLEHPELLQLMLPILRADFAICQDYFYVPDQPFAFPITALGGLEDHEVTRNHLQAWREQTSGAFKLRMFEGDHFFLISSARLLFQLLSDELAGLLRKTAPSIVGLQSLAATDGRPTSGQL
jgi:medium-chain acyl-[acyl-carrier-protein] hydrolase